jgi:type I restriction enzyme S subunit
LITEAAPDSSYELLSVYADIGVRPRKELEQRGNKASTTDGYWLVRKGDLVVNKLLAWMGAVGYSNYDGVTSPAYDILRPIKKVDSKFYHYLFRSPTATRELKRWSRGIMDMRLRLYFDHLGNIRVPVPQIEEQQQIIAHVEELERKHAAQASKAERHINLLEELRANSVWLSKQTQSYGTTQTLRTQAETNGARCSDDVILSTGRS